MKNARKSRSSRKTKPQPPPSPVPSQVSAPALPTDGPQFGEPAATADPTKFTVKHGSDKAAYTILDKERKKLPRPFPAVAGTDEPVLTLADVFGAKGSQIEK